MKKLHPIINTNIFIFGVFALLIIADIFAQNGGIAILGGIGFLLQAGVNFITGIIVSIFTQKRTEKYYLLSALIILLIGFSLCGLWAESGSFNFH
jgi:hypothetical protein